MGEKASEFQKFENDTTNHDGSMQTAATDGRWAEVMVTDGILWRSELMLQQRQAAAVGGSGWRRKRQRHRRYSR